MHERKSAAPMFPDAEYVGDHLVIDKTEWIPGEHPEAHRREAGQPTYPETYFRCLLCGAERLTRADFPERCDAPPDPDAVAWPNLPEVGD